MPAIHVALLGLTHPHTPHHLRTLQVSDHVAQIFLWDPDEPAKEGLARTGQEKVAAFYTDLTALFANESILVAVATGRNDLNPDICIQALEAGVHVISEKPIGKNAAEVQRVVEVARRKGLKLGVCYTNRFQPYVQDARRLVSEGILGRLTSCEARIVTSQIKFRDPKHWLFDREKAGGGILSWLGCHYLDLLRFITGDEVASVSAFATKAPDENVSVETVATVSLRFGRGSVGSLQAGYQLPISTAGYSGAAYDTYVAVRGDLGHLHFSSDDRPLSLWIQSSHPAWAGAPQRNLQYRQPAHPAYGGTSGMTFFEAFITAALGHGEPPATGEDALKVARIVEAACQSSETGRHIEL